MLQKFAPTVLEETVKALLGSGGRLYITAESTGQPARVYSDGENPSLPELEESFFWQQIMGFPKIARHIDILTAVNGR